MNKGLANAARRRAEMRERGEAIQIRNPAEVAKQNPLSLRAAVNAKCYECVGGTLEQPSKNWRNEIRNCTSKLCPLVPVRPYK